MKRPLLPALLGLIAGIACAPHVSPWSSVAVSFGILSLILLALSVVRKNAVGVGLGFVLIFFCVGDLITTLSLEKTDRNSNLIQRAGDQKVYWVGRVLSNCESEETGGKTAVQVDRFKGKDGEMSVSGRVLLRIGEGDCPLKRGDVVQSFSSFKRPDRFRNEGSFDYPFFLLSQGISATTFVETKDFVVKIGEEKGKVLRLLQNLNEETKKSLEALPQEKLRQVLIALLLGEKKGLSVQTQDLFRKTGTTHLLVVSGLHLVMVGGFFYLFFRLVLSLWPPLLLRISAKKWALFLSLFPITFYAALVGFSPSVLRAVLTVLLLGIFLLFSRERDAFSLLVLVAVVLLLVQPLLLFSLSFQLSFLSVASIILLVPPWERFLLKKNEKVFARPWIRRPLEIVWASLAVQVGLLPILVLRFHQIAVFSLPANLVLVPAFSLVVMPLGLLGMFFSWTVPSWSGPLFQAAAACLKPLLSFLEFLSSRPGSSPFLPGFHPVQILLYYALILIFLFPLSKSLKRGAILALILLNLGAWMAPPLLARTDESLKITMLDVGQGDATLVELPHGKRILIDGGGLASSTFDVGEKVLLPSFFSKNIWKIDTVVLTHPHPDHFGGLKAILRAFDPEEVWWNGETVDSPAFQELLEEIQKRGIALVRLDTGIQAFEREGIRFEILHPLPGGWAETRPDSAAINNRSLVIQMSDRGLSFLFAGDIQKETEKVLIESGTLKASFVLKVPHHGSDTSSTEDWVKAVCPRVALVGVGRGNRYRFPKDEVLRRYEALGTEIFRTDQDGEIRLRWDGDKVEVTSFGGRQAAWRLGPPNQWPSSRRACVESSSGSASDSRH